MSVRKKNPVEVAPELPKKQAVESKEKEPDTDVAKLTECLKCSICYRISVRALTLPCGHSMCNFCFHRWKKSDDTRCPTCRKSLCVCGNSRGIAPNYQLRRIVDLYKSDVEQVIIQEADFIAKHKYLLTRNCRMKLIRQCGVFEEIELSENKSVDQDIGLTLMERFCDIWDNGVKEEVTARFMANFIYSIVKSIDMMLENPTVSVVRVSLGEDDVQVDRSATTKGIYTTFKIMGYVFMVTVQAFNVMNVPIAAQSAFSELIRKNPSIVEWGSWDHSIPKYNSDDDEESEDSDSDSYEDE